MRRFIDKTNKITIMVKRWINTSDLMYEVANINTLAEMKSTVKEKRVLWESRIKVK